MDNLHRASVTLLIHGDDLVPEELTALLGRQPRIGARKGETFLGHNGRTILASTGKWVLGTGCTEPPCIDKQINDLLNSLPANAELWRDLTTRFDCHISVGAYFDIESWTGGIMLEAETLGMLGERGLAIDFDIYAPGASK